MRCWFLSALLAVMLFAVPTVAKDEPKKTEPFVGEMMIQTYPAMSFLHGSAETTFEKMMEPIQKNLGPIQQAGKDNKVAITGPVMFVYKGIDTNNFAKPFKMEIGAIVDENAKPVGEFKIRKTEPFKCATILFVGPIATIEKAYSKLMPKIAQAGHEMTGENRELYLYWEGPESPNNIVQLQVGVK